MINVDRIRIAKVRYYDNKRKGVEVTSLDANAILIKIDGEYKNIFDEKMMELPVFSRTLYSNTTENGDDFGTKLIHLSGELKTGLCYILDKGNMLKEFGKPEVSISDIENYIINSKDFYIDRESIIKNKDISRKMKRYYRKLLVDDRIAKDQFNKYFAERIEGYQYKK